MKTAKKILVACILICLTAGFAAAQTQRFVQYDDPVYTLLDRAHAHGWLNYLPQMRPYTETQVYEYLKEIRAHHVQNPGRMSEEVLEKIGEFMKRYRGEKFHLLNADEVMGGSGWIDFGSHFTTNGAFNRLSDTTVRASVDLRGGYGIGDTFFLGFGYNWNFALIPWEIPPYRKFFEPHRYDWVFDTFHLGEGDMSSGRSAIHEPGDIDFSIAGNSESQASIGTRYASFHFGHDVLDWGPSDFANLTLSKTAKPYDFVRLDVPLGKRGHFSWMTGFLQYSIDSRTQDYGKKLVSAHRGEYQLFKWMILAWSETVVYSNRFELGYINPFGLYYLSEMRLGDYDNKLAGWDVIFRVPPVQFYFSFLADDWDFAKIYSPTYYNNMYGIIGGVEVWDLIPKLKLNLEYTYLSHWMYTHRSDLAESDSYNNYEHYGSNLGHVLQPNSHMVYFEAQYEILPRFFAGTSFWFTQDARGDIDNYADWEEERELYGVEENTDLYYRFLDLGISDVPIETNIDWTVWGEYYIPRFGMKFRASYSLEYTKNIDKVAGNNRWDHLFSLEAYIQKY